MKYGKPYGAKGQTYQAFPDLKHIYHNEDRQSMASEIQDIRKLSVYYQKLETLIHLVNYDSLMAEHKRQLKGKAVGIDRVSKEAYDRNIKENLNDLLSRMKTFSYRPKAVKRTYIPKANGKMRPLGIPAYEDRLVQGVMARILNEVYEPRFLDCSYGFRENRNVHQALRKVNQHIMIDNINYVLDCDIKGFFDNVDHKWLMEFLRHDIADKNFLRYIVRFLKAGIMEDGQLSESTKGTPQGGLISPILANVYLHYVLDVWFERHVKPALKGNAYLVRFADDFILLFQYEDEAKDVYERLVKRLNKFGLEVEQDKTHILPFGRYKGTNETFDFLGFTHYNGKTRTGKYTVGHKVSKKKKKVFRQKLKKWAKDNRVLPTDLFMKKLNVKFTSTIRFYSISGMMAELNRLQNIAFDIVFKWINRRSQRRSYTRYEFGKLWRKYVNDLKIYNDIWVWNATPLKV